MNDEQYIPLSAREPLQHVVEEPAGGKQPLVITLKRPSPSDRQLLISRMFAAGLRQPTGKQIRAAELNALIKILGDDAGEEAASKLEMFYDAADLWGRQLVEWREREAQRIIDEKNGAEPIAPEAPPAKPYTEREKNAAELLMYQARSDELVIRLLADAAAYNAGNMFWLVRTHMVPDGLAGGPEALVMSFDKEGVLTKEALDDLIGYIGEPAFLELAGVIDGQYSLKASEEKNSASPLETSRPKDEPSEATSGVLEKHAGISTESIIEPTPESASDQITEKSSSTPSAPTDLTGTTTQTVGPA
jgi:hypothetical protein